MSLPDEKHSVLANFGGENSAVIQVDDTIPSFVRGIRPACIGRLVANIYSDSKLSSAEKLTAMDEAFTVWPINIMLAYRKFRFQFFDKTQFMKMFENETDEIKTVLETLILLYGDNLDEFGKRLKAIQKSFVNQRVLLAWLKSEYQIIPYEALLLGSTNDWEFHRHFRLRSPFKILKSLKLKLEWCSEEKPNEPVVYEMTVKMVAESPAQETFLRIATGDNEYGKRGSEAIELIGQRLEGNSKCLECCYDAVRFPQVATEKLLSKIEQFCDANSVWMHLTKERVDEINGTVLRDNRLKISFYHKFGTAFAVQVGTVVNSNVDECVNSKKGSLVISKVDFIQ
ncbi:hypothetical protein WR25_25435 [Diploscapter pachys]|uniref:Uncharacterized protein n=1 Tax=Diploscapter pachys TaxID=2018661 RepID=A0A2A2J2V9_9BILA|nr:hypothetical protein WR25_25435 [Diploscapter pachys]